MIMKKIIFLSLILVIFLFGNISTVTASETQYTPVQITNLTNLVVSGFNGMILSAGLMTAFPQAYFIAENINPAITAHMRSVYGKFLTDLTNPWNIATPDDLVCSQIVFYAQQQTPASAALGVSNFFVAGKLFWDRIKFKPIAPVVAPLPGLPAQAGDLNTDGHVNIYDYNELVSKFGNPYTIFDYNDLVTNYDK